MSLFQGATAIDAVYFGQSDVPLGPVSFKGATGGNNTATVTPPANSEGDLLVLHYGQGNTQSPTPTPTGWTLWKTVTQASTGGAVTDNCSQIFYRFAPAGGVGAFTLTTGGGSNGHSCYVYSNVNQTTPFGAYAQQKEVGDGLGTKPVAPNTTMTNPNGNALVVHAFTIMFPGSFSNGVSLPGGYSTMYNTNSASANYSCGWYRNDRNNATISSVQMTTGSGDGGFGFTYEILPGSKNTSPLALSVWLGSEKVWPIFVPQLSPWYSPASGTPITVPWPKNAEFCDVVIVSGGAGGTGTGVGGNAQRGGGEGQWGGTTIAVGSNPSGNLYTALDIAVMANAGNDGVGGGNFNTDAADGSYMQVTPRHAGGPGPWWNNNNSHGLDKTSNTNNRNGGNVAAEFVFNGRTYTMASYGTNAGRGGATSNKNGGDGTRPGGGGQSADNGGLTGYNGGKGAHGAAILYWY